MSYTVKTLGPESTVSDAVNFLVELAQSEASYHIDDDPVTIINFKTGDAVFTNAEAETMVENFKRVRELMSWETAWDIYYKAVKAQEGKQP